MGHEEEERLGAVPSWGGAPGISRVGARAEEAETRSMQRRSSSHKVRRGREDSGGDGRRRRGRGEGLRRRSSRRRRCKIGDVSVQGVESLLEKGEAREIREVERQEHDKQKKGRQGHGDLVLCGLADRGGGEAQLRRTGQGASAPAIYGGAMALGSGRAREELAPTSFPMTGRIFLGGCE